MNSLPSSMRIASLPETWYWKCGASQLFVLARAWTSLDQRQPGWKLSRPTAPPPTLRISALPLGNSRVSSGRVKARCSLLLPMYDPLASNCAFHLPTSRLLVNQKVSRVGNRHGHRAAHPRRGGAPGADPGLQRFQLRRHRRRAGHHQGQPALPFRHQGRTGVRSHHPVRRGVRARARGDRPVRRRRAREATPLRRPLRRRAPPAPDVPVRHAGRGLHHAARSDARRGEGVLRSERVVARPNLRGGPQAGRAPLPRFAARLRAPSARVAGGSDAGRELVRRSGTFHLGGAETARGVVRPQETHGPHGPRTALRLLPRFWLVAHVNARRQRRFRVNSRSIGACVVAVTKSTLPAFKFNDEPRTHQPFRRGSRRGARDRVPLRTASVSPARGFAYTISFAAGAAYSTSRIRLGPWAAALALARDIA